MMNCSSKDCYRGGFCRLQGLLKLSMLVLFMLVGVCFFCNKKSMAKSAIISLNVNRPYVNYDVDNDGKNDTIQARSKTKGSTNTLKVILNNKVIYKHKEPEGVAEVSLIKMKKKRTLLYVAHLGEDDSGPREIYLFRGPKWTRLINLNSSKAEAVYGRYAGSPDTVTAKTLTIRYQEMSYMVGAAEYDMTYTFKKDKLIPPTEAADLYIMKQGSNAYKKDAHLIAKEELPVYSAPAEPGDGAATGAAATVTKATGLTHLIYPTGMIGHTGGIAILTDSTGMIGQPEQSGNMSAVFGISGVNDTVDPDSETGTTEEPVTQITTIHAGDDCVFERIIRVNYKPWFEVTIGGVTGWIPAMEDAIGDDGMGRYFQDILMYG